MLEDIERILNKYDPEHDLGIITWQDTALAEAMLNVTERLTRLAEAILNITERLTRLEARIEKLEQNDLLFRLTKADIEAMDGRVTEQEAK